MRALAVQDVLVSMMSTPNWSQRPECREVLTEYNEWSIHKQIVIHCNDFQQTMNKLQSNEITSFHEFLNAKLNIKVR